MSFIIRNTAAEVKITGRVGNVRSNDNANGKKVVNISVAFQRSWTKKENGESTGEFDHTTQWVEFACWEFNADKAANIAKGDVVECSFNMADMKPASFTKEDGTVSMSLKVARASVLLVAKKDTNSAPAQDDEPIEASVNAPVMAEEAI